MTLTELQNYVLFQTNNDTDDLTDYTPYIDGYLNEGYDRIVEAYAGEGTHVGDADYPALAAAEEDEEEMSPNLPAWTHLGIAYWATWLIYRNGNPQRQQRGMQFRAAAEEIVAKIRASGGLAGDTARAAGDEIGVFTNIPYYPYEPNTEEGAFDPYS